MKNEYLTTREVAERFPLSQRHLKHLRQTRAIPYFRLGHKSIVYRVNDLERFLTERRIEAIR